MTVSDSIQFQDLLETYLEEQLDRQAFWIIRLIPELDHTNEEFKNRKVILEDARSDACFKTGLVGFRLTMIFSSLNKLINETFG